MNKQYVIEAVRKIVAAPSAYEGLKKAGQAYLDAVGTERENAAAAVLVEEAKADISTVDETIAFAGSPVAAEVLGEAGVKALEAHARDIKARGAEYCDCDACTAALDVLKNEKIWRA